MKVNRSSQYYRSQVKDLDFLYFRVTVFSIIKALDKILNFYYITLAYQCNKRDQVFTVMFLILY